MMNEAPMNGDKAKLEAMMPPLSLEQTNILKLGRVMRDGVGTEFWKEFQNVIRYQIMERENILHTPLHALPPQVCAAMGDFAGKAAAQESIKGALIALKLVLTLPDTIIMQATELASSKEKPNAPSAP